MKKLILGFIVTIIFTTNVWAKGFTATLNRNPVPEGETVVLTLELQDIDTSSNPDLSELSQDFTIMSVSNGYRTNIVNYDVSKSRQWNLVMIPKHSGDLTIPSIKLDNYQTQPIVLKVTPEGSEPKIASSTVSSRSNYRISAQIDDHNPYVQQQINYQLKIHDGGGLHGDAPVFLTEGDDWIIKSLGEPQVSSSIDNGITSREITFNYALFPQKSGKLEIPAVRFNGYYLTQAHRTDPFAGFFSDDDFFSGFNLNDVFSRRNPIVLTAKSIPVNVKPAVINDGWWLPAAKVELSAEFDSSDPKFVVGEPVGRTIYLKAYGVMENQLPDLKFPNLNNVKQYPEKPLTEMYIENGKIVSLAKINNVYIPSTDGEITLPEINLNWFDVNNDQIATATIPAYKTYAQNNPSVSVAQPVVKQPQAKPEMSQPISTVTQIEQVDNKLEIWLLLGAFVGGIVLTLLLIKLFAFISNHQSSHYKLVIDAAKKGDIHQLRDELLLWGQNRFTSLNITNLQDIAAVYNDQELNRQLDKIREALYGGKSAQWNSKEFIKIFKKISARKNSKHPEDGTILPKLYK